MSLYFCTSVFLSYCLFVLFSFGIFVFWIFCLFVFLSAADSVARCSVQISEQLDQSSWDSRFYSLECGRTHQTYFVTKEIFLLFTICRVKRVKPKRNFCRRIFTRQRLIFVDIDSTTRFQYQNAVFV